MATTTPNYGWDVPTSTDYVKDGATAIETLGDDIDATLYTALGGAYPGLRLVKKQTIGTGVSSVNVTGAFSATYENYKIIVSGGVNTGTGTLQLKLGASTTGYYEVFADISGFSGNPVGLSQSNAAIWGYTGGYTTNYLQMSLDLLNPFAAKWTTYMGHCIGLADIGPVQGQHRVATSYTDFTISGGTMTGGTIYVYGYGAS